MTVAKRIAVCVLFVPALFAWVFLWVPAEYLRTGKVDAMNTLMDRLARWAK